LSSDRKLKIYGQHAEQWQAWRDAGSEPQTRAKAIKIVKSELAKAGIAQFDEGLIRSTLAHDSVSEDSSTINSSLSFMVWDLTENDGKALDYSVDANYFKGLLEQARQFISHFRVKLSSGSETFTASQFVNVKGRGVQPITRIDSETLQQIADREIEGAYLTIRRWKLLGATKGFTKKKMRELSIKVLADYIAA
jgi:hypothetical protein